MRFQGWNKQTKLTHFFSLPNEIFLLGLAHGELAVYCYLKYLEDRRTHQCWPSYRNIGKAVGMSENTVRKYVAKLEERGLITTAYTTMRAKDGRSMNGHPMYTICPFREVVDDHYRAQMEALELQTQRARALALMSEERMVGHRTNQSTRVMTNRLCSSAQKQWHRCWVCHRPADTSSYA